MKIVLALVCWFCVISLAVAGPLFGRRGGGACASGNCEQVQSVVYQQAPYQQPPQVQQVPPQVQLQQQQPALQQAAPMQSQYPYAYMGVGNGCAGTQAAYGCSGASYGGERRGFFKRARRGCN